MILRGEVVAFYADGGEPTTVKAADLVDADPRACGIAAGVTNKLPNPDADGNYGRLNVVTSGQVPALVLGPCSAGDSLCLAAGATDKAQWSTTGKYLKKGSGCFTAMEDVAAGSTPVLIDVKVGGAGGSGGGGLTAQIHAVHGDYLECYPWNGSAFDTGTIILVARQWLLQRYYWDTVGHGGTAHTRNGESYNYSGDQTRTATKSGLASEQQKITPDYIVGDTITYIEKDYTGVTVSGTALTCEESTSSRGWDQSS